MTSLAAIPRLLRLRLSRRLRATSVGTRTILVCLVGVVFIFLMTSSSQIVLNNRDQVAKSVNVDDVKERLRQSRNSAGELKNRPGPIDVVRLSPQLEQFAAKKLNPRSGVHPESQQNPVCSNAGGTAPPENLEEPMKWQPVSASNSDGFVFSAHLDLRYTPTPAVVVVGLSRSLEGIGGQQIVWYCRLWYRKTDISDVKSYVTKANTRYSFESHGRKYTAAFHVCHLPDGELVPYAVSLIRNPCDQSNPDPNLLKVITSQLTPPEMTSPGLVNFTVCVTPFNYRYNRADQLLEMIEVNRMYGAQRFVFYNYSSIGNVTHLLNSYRRWYGGDLIEVIQWPLPIPVDVWPRDPDVTPEVHYFGQLAALNDCLYRSIGRSTFVVNTDLDEFVVPRRRDSWADMLNDATTSWPSRRMFASRSVEESFPAVYMMKNVFFRSDWPKDTKFSASNLITLATTERETKIFQFNERSKIIAWTKATWMVGVHAAAELGAECETVYVDDADGLLHHYRLWEDDPNKPRPEGTIDRRMHQYADVIIRRTDNVRLLANL